MYESSRSAKRVIERSPELNRVDRDVPFDDIGVLASSFVASPTSVDRLFI